jgi:hypothetical protein
MIDAFSVRDKAILIGLYMSKFDEDALLEFGFDSFNQAFNVFAFSIGTKPASIKNYRDEFDPYFPNQRQGWHKRALREYCKKIMDEFNSLNFVDFSELIKDFIFVNNDIDKITKQDKSESVAKRLITGKAAEEYFKLNYRNIDTFVDYELKDTTYLGCGFDFKLLLRLDFYCVEVKGLNLNTGNIVMTEKEYIVASELQDRYCLFIVKNFIEKPNHQIIFNPINSGLNFKRTEKPVIQISYSTSV